MKPKDVIISIDINFDINYCKSHIGDDNFEIQELIFKESVKQDIESTYTATVYLKNDIRLENIHIFKTKNTDTNMVIFKYMDIYFKDEHIGVKVYRGNNDLIKKTLTALWNNVGITRDLIVEATEINEYRDAN